MLMTGAGRTEPVAECYRYLDALNTRHGRRSIQAGQRRRWWRRSEMDDEAGAENANYTTSWKDLPRARA